MTINVICRKDAVNKDGKVPIIFLFIHERKTKKVSTGIYVALKHWDLEKQCPTPNCPNREEIQFQLSTQLHAYKKKMQQLEVLDIPITFDTLLKERKPKNLTTVGEFFNQIIQRLEQVERYGTASNYKITVSLLERFHSLNIRFEEINLQFLREFEAFLRQRGNMSNSMPPSLPALRRCIIVRLRKIFSHPKRIRFNNSRSVVYGKTHRKELLRKRIFMR